MSSLTSAQLEDVCNRYVELIGQEDVDAMMSLFAEACTVEDPVGNEPLIGRPAVREFYASLVEVGCKGRMAGEVHAVPDAGAAAFQLELDTSGLVVQAIDVMRFDDDGLISSMTAIWRM